MIIGVCLKQNRRLPKITEAAKNPSRLYAISSDLFEIIILKYLTDFFQLFCKLKRKLSYFKERRVNITSEFGYFRGRRICHRYHVAAFEQIRGVLTSFKQLFLVARTIVKAVAGVFGKRVTRLFPSRL